MLENNNSIYQKKLKEKECLLCKTGFKQKSTCQKYCINCGYIIVKNKRKEWVIQNGERKKKVDREYYHKYKDEKKEERKVKYHRNKNNKEYMRRRREIAYNSRQKNKKKRSEKEKLLRRTNPKCRLDTLILSGMYQSLKKKRHGYKWEKVVGYNLQQLMFHLERQFDNKMNWGNYGSYWSLDHKKPRKLFKYNTIHDIEFKNCWRLENLQPLEKIKNLSKGYSY